MDVPPPALLLPPEMSFSSSLSTDMADTSILAPAIMPCDYLVDQTMSLPVNNNRTNDISLDISQSRLFFAAPFNVAQSDTETYFLVPIAGIGSNSHGNILSENQVSSVLTNENGLSQNVTTLSLNNMQLISTNGDIPVLAMDGFVSASSTQEVYENFATSYSLANDPLSSMVSGDFLSTDQPDLNFHMDATNFIEPVRPASTDSVAHFKYTCDTCGYQTENSFFADEHAVTWNTARHYRCDICDYVFDRINKLSAHEQICRKAKQYRCPSCGDMFSREINYKLHVVTHNTSGELRCPICNDTFRRLASFRCHLKLHAVEDLISCAKCNEEFGTIEELRDHMRLSHNHSKENIHVCKQCGAIFKRPLELVEHLITHKKIKETLKTTYRRRVKKNADGTSGRHVCDICSKTFSKKNALNRHLLIHTGERPFECKVCNQTFNQKGALMFHEAKHLPQQPHTCQLCGVGFSQRGNLRTHVKRVHPAAIADSETMFTCPLCSCSFKSLQTLSSHLSKRHMDGLSQDLSRDDLLSSVQYLVRSAELGERKTLKDVKALINGIAEKCTSLATNGTSESQSTNSAVGQPVQVAGRKVCWQCTYCQKAFAKPSDLARHRRMHTGEKPFCCQMCPQRYALRTTLDKHVRSKHLHIKSARCHICWKELSNSFTLATHLRIHSNVTFDCQLCERKFRTNSDLRGHVKRQHSDPQRQKPRKRPPNAARHLPQPLKEAENGTIIQLVDKGGPNDPRVFPLVDEYGNLLRPYCCPYCPMRFKGRSHMWEHRRSHENARSYTCRICQRAFFTSSALRDHVLIHTGVKKHLCTICNKRFLTKRTLGRHALVHTDRRPFICPYCGKRFKRGVLCRRHIKRHKNTTDAPVTCDPPPAPEVGHRSLEYLPAEQLQLPATVMETNFENWVFPTSLEDINAQHPMLTSDDNQRLVTPNFFRSPSPSSYLASTAPRMHVNMAMEEPRGDENPYLLNSDMTAVHELQAHGQTGHAFFYEEPPQQQHAQSQEQQQEIPTENCGQGLNSPPTVFECTVCAGSFDTDEALNRHTEIHYDTRLRYSCPVCGECFAKAAHLTRHVYAEHPKKGHATAESQKFNNRKQPKPQKLNSSNFTGHLPVGSINQNDQDNMWRIMESTEKQASDEPVFMPVSSGERVCTVCSKTFKKPSDLKRHMRIHTGEKPFECECGKTFRVKSTLLYHKQTHEHNRSSMFRCHVCNKSFAARGSLKVHLRQHTNEKRFRCPQCSIEFRSSTQLNQHAVKAHPPQLTVFHEPTPVVLNSGEASAFTPVVRSQEKSVVQPQSAVLSDSDHLILQVVSNATNELHLNVRREAPPVDGPRVQNENSISMDVAFLRELVARGVTLSIPISYGQNSESSGHNITVDPAVLLEHAVRQSTDIPAASMSAKSRNAVMTTPSDFFNFDHMAQGVVTASVTDKTAEASFVVECEICDLKFATAQQSREHFQSPDHEMAASMQSQLNGRQHLCELCGKTFTTFLRLIRHNKSHTGERPFQCTVCGECFAQKNSLQKHHISKHTNIRQHVCPFCHRAFALKYNMEKHVQRAHGQANGNQNLVAVDSHNVSAQRVRSYLLSL